MVDTKARSSDAARQSDAFVRIPGTTDDGSPTSLIVNGTTISVQDLLAALEANISINVHQVVQAAASGQISRAELHQLSSFLFNLMQHGDGHSTASALADLLIRRAPEPEAVFIGIQLLRVWSSRDAFSEQASRLQEALTTSVQSITFAPDTTRRQLAEVRYVLVRAFESAALHEAAAIAIRLILVGDHPRLVAERKDLASHVIAAANGLRVESSHLSALKRLAAAVFATGTAPASLREAASIETQQKRITFLVTAQDAERRRQFGLASAIELHKAATLIGRQMTLAEFESALTFHHDASAATPGNQRWFSRDEWLTAQRLLLLAVEELPCSTLAALGLLRLLATAIKVEEPSDSRVSFKRPDALDPLTRRRALREAERLADSIGTTAEQLHTVAQEQAARLIDPRFLLHNPVVISLDQVVLGETHGPSALPKGSSAINLSTSDLTARLLTDSSSTLVSRLVAGDFEVLKSAQGLSLIQFKTLLEKIRPRALSDSWARLAFLDIVRAPHAIEVNVRVRTGALGALVNEARKLGRLTASLEKEAFAASAEIPLLPHLQDTVNTSDPEEEAHA